MVDAAAPVSGGAPWPATSPQQAAPTEGVQSRRVLPDSAEKKRPNGRDEHMRPLWLPPSLSTSTQSTGQQSLLLLRVVPAALPSIVPGTKRPRRVAPMPLTKKS